MKKYTYKADVNKWEPEYNYYEADYKEQEVYGFGLFWPRFAVTIFFIIINLATIVFGMLMASKFEAAGNWFLTLVFCGVTCSAPFCTLTWWASLSVSYFDQLEYFIKDETIKPARIRAKQRYEETRAEFIKYNEEHPELNFARDYVEGRVKIQDFCAKIKEFPPEEQLKLFEVVEKYKTYRQKLKKEK